MITYKDIYDIARNERYSKELQKLPASFIEDVSDYLREKKEAATRESDDISDMVTKTKKQLENAVTLFKELIIRRRKKILDLVLIASETGISKKDFDNMFGFEKELFDSLMNSVKLADGTMSEILNGKGKVNGGEKIVFKENVGELMDLTGEKIGPFKKDDVAELSKEIAKILVDDGKAEPAL
ncbi:hypothetical protein COU59_03265 [Candidatus Pacearchaeota archaeon CG10_big_fil_rev_8_21_14_0_10_34_12]|nr:MAG: hypothetical protein COU59_03265 [Candidatus Pacearchaeota archaeon CG10_big_fil_rev_8_21_14_0_10_34_12]